MLPRVFRVSLCNASGMLLAVYGRIEQRLFAYQHLRDSTLLMIQYRVILPLQ